MSDRKQPDSDRAMARLLSDALRPAAGAASDSACPDAGILAAYAEHNLDEPETAQWEQHFAECGRCQKILAVLTVSSEEPLTKAELERFGRKLAAAELGAPIPAHRELGTKVTPFERPRTSWRWLAPAVGVAAAFALWIALRPLPRHSGVAITAQKTSEPAGPPSSLEAQTNAPSPPNESLEARANLPAPPAAAESEAEQHPPGSSEFARALKKENAPAGPAAPVQEPPAPQGRAAAPASQAEPVLQAANQAPENLARTKQDENASAASAANANPVAAEAKASAANETAALPAASAAAASAAAPSPPPPASADANARGVVPPAPAAPSAASAQPAFNTGTASGASAGSGSGMGAAPANRTVQSFAARQALGGLAANRPGRIVTVATPNVNVLWRVGPGGTIERSADRGQSWQPQASGVTSDLLAGAAPSDQVAWVAGRAGVLLRTTDGEHWQRVTTPAPFPDWTAIEATDAQHATISSADRRRLATEDGGQTWQQQ